MRFTLPRSAPYMGVVIGKEAYSRAEDPPFVDAAAHDLSLPAASPCHASGPAAGPTTGPDGRSRFNPPDIGAYERL